MKIKKYWKEILEHVLKHIPNMFNKMTEGIYKRFEDADKKLQIWEGKLDEIEENVNKLWENAKIKWIAYDLAEHNLQQIEENLYKFEQLIEIFENRSSINDDFPTILDTIKDLSRDLESFQYDQLENLETIMQNEPINLRQLAEIVASLQAQCIIYAQQISK